MQKKQPPIESLFAKAEEFSTTTLEILRLKTISKSADVLSTVVAYIALLVAFGLASILINVGLALWVGTLLNNVYLGFFTVGGFYFILAILFYFFKNSWVKRPLSNKIIGMLYKP